jgi:predicted dehydrogenase
MRITPYFLGSGRSANALKKSLSVLAMQYPDWRIDPPVTLARDEPIDKLGKKISKGSHPILFITNPNALHARAILSGEKAGFHAIVVEKPAVVSLDEIDALSGVELPVAVCHVYRQMWGIQTIKELLDADELGSIISIEGSYWHSSAAKRALQPELKGGSWKNDSELSGDSDALIDTGSHWADAVTFLMGSYPEKSSIWLSYANAEAAHRDTHAHISFSFPGGRAAFGSISKTLHGVNNRFEILVVGTRKSALWNFERPDEILIGEGASRTVRARSDSRLGSQQAPFHGLGWLEGYIEILRQLILSLSGQEMQGFPTLKEHLEMMAPLLKGVKESSQS